MIFYQFSALSHFQRFEELSYPFYPQILESDHTLLWKKSSIGCYLTMGTIFDTLKASS